MDHIFSNQKIHIILIFLFVCFVYANTLRNDFVIDDYTYVLQGSLSQDLTDFPLFFTDRNQPGFQSSGYSPLKTLWHTINFHLWGAQPVGHHAMALVIHILNTVIVYKIVLMLFPVSLLAFLCSLFFGLHPVHTESVSFLTASVDGVGVVFLLASFYYYIRARQGAEDVQTFPYFFSLFFAFFAVFSYELTIFLPLVLVFFEFCQSDSRWDSRNIFRRVMPYFLVVLFYILIKWFVLKPGIRESGVLDSFYLTMLIVFKAWAQYILMTLWPVRLCLDHVLSRGIFSFDPSDFREMAVLSQSFFDGKVMFSLFLLVAVIVFAFKFFRKHPVVTFGIGWFFISLLPSFILVRRGIFFAERFLYLPSFGFCLVLAYGLCQLLYQEKTVMKIPLRVLSLFLIAVILVSFAMRTARRNRDWKNNLTLMSSTVRVNPHSSRMWLYLADAFRVAGKFKEANGCFDEALDIKEDNPLAHFLKGITLMQADRTEQSIAHFYKAILIKKDFAEVYLYLAKAFRDLGQEKKARESFGKFKDLYQRQGKGKELKDIEKTLWGSS